ncbi:Fc.00g019140.m01.CDS01 [Cosmosporella sp. VM-42]
MVGRAAANLDSTIKTLLRTTQQPNYDGVPTTHPFALREVFDPQQWSGSIRSSRPFVNAGRGPFAFRRQCDFDVTDSGRRGDAADEGDEGTQLGEEEVVRRKAGKRHNGYLYIICKANPRHKQRQS